MSVGLGKFLGNLWNMAIRNKPLEGDNCDIEYTPRGARINCRIPETDSVFSSDCSNYEGFFKLEGSTTTENDTTTSTATVSAGYAIIHNSYLDIAEASFTIDSDCFINFQCPYTPPVYGDDGMITSELVVGNPVIVKEEEKPIYTENVFQTVIGEIEYSGDAITKVIQHQHGAIIGFLSDFYDAISDQQQETQAQANENRDILSDISDFIGLDDLNEFLDADLSQRDDLGTYGMVALLVPSGYIYSYGLEEWHATGDVSFYPESGVHYLPVNGSGFTYTNTDTYQYRASFLNQNSVNAAGGSISGGFLWELKDNHNIGSGSGSVSDDFEHITGSINSYGAWVYSSPSFDAEKVKGRIKWYLTPPE